MNKVWSLNYEIVSSQNRIKFLKEILNELEKKPALLICESLERVLCYYDLFDEEMKSQLKKLINNMRKCHFCNRCCKNIFWWDRFFRIVNEFEELVNIQETSTSQLSSKVAVIVPNYLSANSFLQPSVDMLMSLKHLKENGFDTIFVDNRVSKYRPEELYQQIETCKYVFITTTPYDHIQNYFLNYRLKYVCLLVNYIKARDPRKQIVIGGAHGTIRPDIMFSEGNADYIIRGEYDYVIDSVINDIINKHMLDPQYVLDRNTAMNYIDIPYRHNVEKYMERQEDFPEYEDIDFAVYYGDNYVNGRLKKVNNYAAILASRGCLNNCSFCFNFFGNEVRYRSPDSVADEMLKLQQKGVRGLYFMDSTFTQNREWVNNVCKKMIKKKISIPWSAETRCDCIDSDMLQLMKRANCKALWFGVESFCGRVLRNNFKYKSEEVSYRAIDICRKNDIQPLQFIMLGAPGESVYSLNSTIRSLAELGEAYVESAMIATPRFGTKYYELSKKQFPMLGQDFYSLMGVRGLVGNNISVEQLISALKIINNRERKYL